MTLSRIAVAAALLALALIQTDASAQPASAGAAPATTVNSWGPFRLGMSEHQVRAIKGYAWVETSGIDRTWGKPWRFLEAKTQAFGWPISLDISLSGDGVVDRIGLSRVFRGSEATPAHCKDAFVEFVRQAAVTYGPFGAVFEPGATQPRDGLNLTAETKSVPDSSSVYSQMTALDTAHEPVFPEITVVARRTTETAQIDIGTGWGGFGGGERTCYGVDMWIGPVIKYNR